MKAYDKVLAARSSTRPTSQVFIKNIFENFTEFHGDRACGDDPAVIGGIATLYGFPVTVIGLEKGRTTEEKIKRNFGSAHPEGYRKALRLMKQAEKFHRPVVCFIDTAGAYCGLDAEERGQGYAIANNLYEMSTLRTPIISILIGEGGSGGALALGVADEVWMLENSVYSVISPEGCAGILWKDAKKAPDAAECLHLTASDLLGMGIIDRIVSEKSGAFVSMFRKMKKMIRVSTERKLQKPVDILVEERYARFRAMGQLAGSDYFRT